MGMAMIGVDFRTAAIDLREKISLTRSDIEKVMQDLRKISTVDGTVVISTCNRTEIYLSGYEFMDNDKLKNIFAKYTQVPRAILDKCCYIKRSDELIKYLFEMACGLHSMILGEDQIITQVGEAIDLAMSEKSSNPILNTLFRHAVTCAKRAKCEVNIKHVSPSIVSGAVNMAEEYLKNNEDVKVLVIGNGEIGRLAAQTFLDLGCDVCMTLRQYKYTDVIIPKGCKTITYDRREEMIPLSDIVISSTKSPHFTITYDMVSKYSKKPDYFFDLALPRDIEPSVKKIEETKCIDVDDIGRSTSCFDKDQLDEIRMIIAKYYGKFNEWLTFHNNLREEAAAK